MWPLIQKDVQHWCRSCHKCQRMGTKNLKMEPRQVMLVHDIFVRWGVDAIGPLPRTARGKIHILTAVDYLSKWSEAKAVKSVDGSQWLISYLSMSIVGLECI